MYIKLSTQQCNLHRQTLAVEWPVLKSSVTFNVVPSYKSVRQISALLELLRIGAAGIVKWKCLGATTAQLRTGRPHKLIEWDRRVLKHVAHKNLLSSVATLTTEFQIASGSNISTITVCLKIHEIGFHGRAALK